MVPHKLHLVVLDPAQLALLDERFPLQNPKPGEAYDTIMWRAAQRSVVEFLHEQAKTAYEPEEPPSED